MKGETHIDHDAKTVRLLIVLEDIADPGRSMELIRNAARCCWPNILFNFESPADAQEIESGPTPADWEAKPAPAARKPERKPRDHSKPIAPGSVSAFALEAVQRLNTTDPRRIAAELKLKVNSTAALIARLRRGGHLQGEAA